MKFRKTALVDASQWFVMGDHSAVVPVPYDHPTNLHGVKPRDWGWCPTLEGGHLVEPGDWILTGVHGEHWPCKDDIFRMTYEPEDARTPAALPAFDVFEEGLVSVRDTVARMRESAETFPGNFEAQVLRWADDIEAAIVAPDDPPLASSPTPTGRAAGDERR